MTGHLPLPLGTAAQASLERAVRLAALTPGQHLLGVLLTLAGVVLESLERVVRLEVGAPGALESPERVVDLTRDGLMTGVSQNGAAVLDGATLASQARVGLVGALAREARVDLVQVGAAEAERVANPRDRREEAGLLALLHGGVLPPIPGAVQESQARADQAEDHGTVMAGRQVDHGRQVASRARVDHGIKLASWFNNLHW